MLLNIFVSLLPLAIYLFVLAGINRGSRPVILTGIGETLGLFFAFSGFLLFTGPQVLNALYLSNLGAIPLEVDQEEAFEDAWRTWTLIWGLYFFAIAALVGTLLFLRRNVRGIYNVDLQQFRVALHQSFEEEGLTAMQQGNVLLLYRAADSPDNRSLPPLAEMTLCAFPALCHVNLRWVDGPSDLREKFESVLDRNLEDAVAIDNPTANWLLGIASLLFGALIMILAMMVFARFLPRRGF